MLDPQVTGYRRDQEEGGGAGPSSYRVQARSRRGRWYWALKLQGPGEIKRREVVLDTQVTGYKVQARSRGERWYWALKLTQKRS